LKKLKGIWQTIGFDKKQIMFSLSELKAGVKVGEMYGTGRAKLRRKLNQAYESRINQVYKPIITVFRWSSVVAILLLYFFNINTVSSRIAFLSVFSVSVLYNAIVSMYISKETFNEKRSPLIAYLDILLISFFCYHIQGIDSDLYVLYFLVIKYCVIFSDSANTIYISLFAITCYLLTCILHSIKSGEEIRWIRLIIKCLLIMLDAVGTSIIRKEIRMYNKLHRQEFRLARIDRLTGLANRRYLEQKLKEETTYADSSGGRINILLFDLDNFKKYNDTYGHILGDSVLFEFSRIIREVIRKSDVAVRYGGEEFMVLIRDIDIVIAKSVAERIRRKLEERNICIKDQDNLIRMTVSCGIAQYPTHACDIRTAIDCADKALYHAKKMGRNKVVCYDEVMSQA